MTIMMKEILALPRSATATQRARKYAIRNDRNLLSWSLPRWSHWPHTEARGFLNSTSHGSNAQFTPVLAKVALYATLDEFENLFVRNTNAARILATSVTTCDKCDKFLINATS